MRIGNDRDFLIRVVSQCLPYVGYPRSLNAVNCVQAAAEEMEDNCWNTVKCPAESAESSLERWALALAGLKRFPKGD